MLYTYKMQFAIDHAYGCAYTTMLTPAASLGMLSREVAVALRKALVSFA